MFGGVLWCLMYVWCLVAVRWCQEHVWLCLAMSNECLVVSCAYLVVFYAFLVVSFMFECLVHVSCRTYQDSPERTNFADLILELAF